MGASVAGWGSRSFDDGSSDAAYREDLDVSDATFAWPDLTTFCCLEGLGLLVVGQWLEPDRVVLACRVVEPDQWCRRCGCEGSPRDTVVRRLAHEPLGWAPTTLAVTVRRYRCTGSGPVWRQEITRAGEPHTKLSRRGPRSALEGIAIQHLSVARAGRGPGSLVEHRQRRGPGRGTPGPHRGPRPSRRCPCARRR